MNRKNIILIALRQSEARIGTACRLLQEVDPEAISSGELRDVISEAVHDICNAAQTIESVQRLVEVRDPD